MYVTFAAQQLNYQLNNSSAVTTVYDSSGLLTVTHNSISANVMNWDRSNQLTASKEKAQTFVYCVCVWVAKKCHDCQQHQTVSQFPSPSLDHTCLCRHTQMPGDVASDATQPWTSDFHTERPQFSLLHRRRQQSQQQWKIQNAYR